MKVTLGSTVSTLKVSPWCLEFSLEIHACEEFFGRLRGRTSQQLEERVALVLNRALQGLVRRSLQKLSLEAMSNPANLFSFQTFLVVVFIVGDNLLWTVSKS